MGTLSENQTQEHNQEEDRQRREDLGAAATGKENAQERRRAAPRLKGLWTCAVAAAHVPAEEPRRASGAHGGGKATGGSHGQAVTQRSGFDWGSASAPSSTLPVSPPRAREPQSTWSADRGTEGQGAV